MLIENVSDTERQVRRQALALLFQYEQRLLLLAADCPDSKLLAERAGFGGEVTRCQADLAQAGSLYDCWVKALLKSARV